MGTLLVYSVEADGDAKGAQWEKNVKEILASVNFAGDFEDTQSGGRKTWVAVKLITVDAEHSWYQPGIDAFVTALSREFNQPSTESEPSTRNGQPVVYGTYQAYLRRTPLHLARAMDDAKKHGYSLGVKLVRGAYHGQEIAYHGKRIAASKPGEEVEPYPAVWLHKDETDRCFDKAAELLIRHTASSLASRNPQQPKLGLLFGTHNKQSCQIVLDCMLSSGLAHKNEDGVAEVKSGVEDMVCFGQLYGMRDELTNWIASVFKSESPMAFKYLPYGALAEVMPYLSRRAIENQSVLSGEGGAAEERRRAGDLIRKRIIG
ncbi:hypothetical protein BN14_07771 [Rhizoctonia solani AG-1 IB]|uniref:Proline dehydrogenase n=2 Tax=Rhizoctonia solani TaxID=456999 RepID=A0A8H3BMC9_9AGAM|nr:unnamed protein product [Rhizoctonia solani]CCO33686.1 hypothetical protein BN14_07771 [Rhizoctonia solani AG-1 IB]